MKNKIKLMTAICSLFFLFISSIKAQSNLNSTEDSDKIVMPIEVLGPEGIVVSQAINLSLNQSVSAKRLWLQVNNLGYEDKGSIKINEGDWYVLNHQSVNMQHQEKARGGMVHGGFNTIRFSIPADNFIEGTNNIQFRFDKSDGISIGYRVIKFNLLDSSDNKLLSSDVFEEENPDEWEAPYTDAQSIAEGKDLWYNGDLWNHYLPDNRKGFWYGYELSSRKQIEAKCTSCHTQDGRDLEMFSYSNKSIIERSKFHGLSEEDGKKIVSYIRNLSKEHDNVDRSGRPWNPPYQPGPSVADLEIHNWHAGAGIDAVLDEDKDLIPFMFPNGFSEQAMIDYFDADKVEDRTLVPVVQQFPDWKHWLPIVHPMDAYGNHWDDVTLEKLPTRDYNNLRDLLENNEVSEIESSTLISTLSTMSWSYRAFNQEGGSGHWRSKNSPAYAAISSDVGPELAKTSLARLKAVKTFEVVNEFSLQDKSIEIYSKDDNVPERQWPGRLYHVFEVPPHFTSCEETSGCKNFVGQPRATGRYESTNWYELQYVIAGGHGISGSNAPMDWKYQHNFISGAGDDTSLHEPLRYFRSINGMYQIRSWAGATSPRDKVGFGIRHQAPTWILGGVRGGQGKLLKTLDSYKPGLTKLITDAMLRLFLREMDRPQNEIPGLQSDGKYSYGLWKKSGSGSDAVLDVEQTDPFTNERSGLNYSMNFYQSIPKFAAMGADCNLLNRFIDWCKLAWPSWDTYWEDLRQTVQPTLSLESLGTIDSPSEIKAILLNQGSNTNISWFVNDIEITSVANSLTLSDDYFNPGDHILCLAKTTMDCITPSVQKEVNSSLIIPASNLTVTLGENSVVESEQLNSEIGELLKIQKTIDLKPIIWLDAMDLKNSGNYQQSDLISSWKDKSGNENHATQSTNALKPKYNIDSYGFPSVWFGADDLVNRLELIPTSKHDFLNNDWSIYIIGKEIGHQQPQYVIGNKNPWDKGFGFGFDIHSKSGQGQVNFKLFKKSSSPRRITYPFNYLVNLTKESDEYNAYINGDLEYSAPSNNGLMTNSTPIYLGAFTSSFDSNTGDLKYHKGPIYEILVFDRKLSENEKIYIEGYLANKWDFNERLQSYHRFKNHSPLKTNIITPNGSLSKDLSQPYIKEIDDNDFGNYEVGSGMNSFTFELLNESLSINDINNISKLKVYPNPNIGSFRINDNTVDQIEVYNMIGVKNTISKSQNGVFSLPSNLPDGVYFVIINSKGNKNTIKVIKSSQN